MATIKSWLWYIFLIIISNIFFLFIYQFVFQFDGSASCGSPIACVTAKFISLYAGILILILCLFFGLIYKKEGTENIVPKVIAITDIFLLGIIFLVNFFGTTSLGIKFQHSNYYCYININKNDRNVCLYFKRAVADENVSECDMLPTEATRFACRDKIKWNKFDKCNTPENFKAGVNCYPDKKQ